MRKKELLMPLLVCLLIISCLATSVFAANSVNKTPAINWSKYSYDELLLLQEDLNTYIKDMERQYAIENANRTITLNDDAPTVYKGKTFTFTPEVTRVKDDAPKTTRFVWTSSDKTVAKVSTNGVVTALKHGEAIITCSAADDEYVLAEATVRVVMPVEKLTMEESKVTLLLSEQNPAAADAALVCTVAPENAHIQEVSWTSSNEAVATVDENGNVHAIAPGTAKITATSQQQSSKPKTAACTITVQQAVSAIETDAEQLTLNVSDSQTLTAAVLPETATNKELTWQSSNPEVAAVSAKGKITAVAPGTATISCTAADGSEVTSTCSVTVIQLVDTVKIDAASASTVNKNDSLDLNVLITPENATDQTVTWESSNPEAVTVNSKGTVKAVGVGTATISCTTADGSNKTAEITIHVPTIAADSLEYAVTEKKGLKIPFKYYGAAEDLTITSKSSKYFTAEIQQKGEKAALIITPLKAGTETITLSDNGDSKSTVTLTITIEHSACYDSTSYPAGNYKQIMEDPSVYAGTPMSVYGRVLHVSQGMFKTVLHVAIQGKSDNVFHITCSKNAASEIAADDYITIYGECTGTKDSSAITEESVTIPAIDAEKFYLGKH